MQDIATLSPDDPQLEGWYHTIELGNGLCSRGRMDLRDTVDIHLPESLEGKTALDVGTCDGFWAFEMEKRGAQVTAIDVERWSDFDFLPGIGQNRRGPTAKCFDLAHTMRGSSVDRRICNVYELSPELGIFDFVFCGSLLLHLQNPLKALVNIRSVTKERAVIATLHSPELEDVAPGKPWMAFGNRGELMNKGDNKKLGRSCVYWHMNTCGLREMMEYAGFRRTEPLGLAPVPPTDTFCTVVAGYP